MKKTVAILISVLLMLGLLAGCGAPQEEPATTASESASTSASASASDSSDASASSDVKKPNTTDKENSELKFGLSIHYTMDDWGKVCSEAFAERCEELGIQYEVISADNDFEKQLSDVESFLTREFDAIAINPLDVTSLSSIGTELYDEGIPFIAVTDQDEYPVYGYVDGGQESKGKASAEVMVEDLGGEGKVLLMTTTSTPTLMEARRAGVDQALEGTNVTIVDTKLGDTIEDFVNLTNDVLTSGEEFDAIYATHAVAITGVLTALKNNERKDIPVYGIDAEYTVMQLMKEGYGTAVTAQFPSDTAVTLVDTMLAMLRGEEVGENGNGIVVEPRISEVVTVDNLEEMCMECWNRELE